jgi:hypothetical protein
LGIRYRLILSALSTFKSICAHLLQQKSFLKGCNNFIIELDI